MAIRTRPCKSVTKTPFGDQAKVQPGTAIDRVGDQTRTCGVNLEQLRSALFIHTHQYQRHPQRSHSRVLREQLRFVCERLRQVVDWRFVAVLVSEVGCLVARILHD